MLGVANFNETATLHCNLVKDFWNQTLKMQVANKYISNVKKNKQI